MPYCPHCDREYAEELEQCPVCRHLLLPEKPVWRPFDPTKPPVEVATVQGEFLAAVIKGRLESQGIPTVIRRESVGAVYGLIVDGLGAQHILVPADLAAEAREILQSVPLPEEEA